MRLTPEKMRDLLTEAAVFSGYLTEVAEINAAEREPDRQRRRDLQEKYVARKTTGFPGQLSTEETQILFDLAVKVLRSILAKRTAAFRAVYGIEIEGIPTIDGGPW